MYLASEPFAKLTLVNLYRDVLSSLRKRYRFQASPRKALLSHQEAAQDELKLEQVRYMHQHKTAGKCERTSVSTSATAS